MHTRRVGAFLIGAWLFGSVLMFFVTSQSLRNVDRFFADPPAAISRDVDELGHETARQIFRYQAAQHNRHISETWEIMQLGLGAALLSISFFTSHRSRIVLTSTGIMFVMVLIMYFYLTPAMNALSRSFDFLPAGAGTQARESFSQYMVWYRVLGILKTLLAIVIALRLLFDHYEWRDKLAPKTSGAGNSRRRRRPHSVRAAPEPVPSEQLPESNQEPDRLSP